MRGLLLLSVICVQFYASYGHPGSHGGGVYSYSDSTGNRYGGSYELKDGQVAGFKGDNVPIPNFIPNFNSIFPQNFMNFGNFIPPFNPFMNNAGLPGNFGGIPGFGIPNMGGFGAPNLAASGAAVGPGFLHQFASINPTNPGIPNINVMNRFAETPDADGTKPQFYSVSSSSYSSSSNLNGQGTSNRAAETVVNDNGKITKYSVHS